MNQSFERCRGASLDGTSDSGCVCRRTPEGTRRNRPCLWRFPLSRNAILAGLLLGLERASGEVGITMMLGGNLDDRTNTLSLEILNCVLRRDFDAATALCVLLVGFATVVSELLLIVQAKTVF